jgi:hypothetical protein
MIGGILGGVLRAPEPQPEKRIAADFHEGVSYIHRSVEDRLHENYFWHDYGYLH